MAKEKDSYIRFDLKPVGGRDLKAYISRRAAEESLKRGERVSMTKYLQELIDRDASTNELGDRVEQIMVKLMTLSGEDQDMVIQIAPVHSEQDRLAVLLTPLFVSSGLLGIFRISIFDELHLSVLIKEREYQNILMVLLCGDVVLFSNGSGYPTAFQIFNRLGSHNRPRIIGQVSVLSFLPVILIRFRTK